MNIQIELTPDELDVVNEALGVYFTRRVNELALTGQMIDRLSESDTKKSLKREYKDLQRRTRTADSLRDKLEPFVEEHGTSKRAEANAVA